MWTRFQESYLVPRLARCALALPGRHLRRLAPQGTRAMCLVTKEAPARCEQELVLRPTGEVDRLPVFCGRCATCAVSGCGRETHEPIPGHAVAVWSADDVAVVQETLELPYLATLRPKDWWRALKHTPELDVRFDRGRLLGGLERLENTDLAELGRLPSMCWYLRRTTLIEARDEGLRAAFRSRVQGLRQRLGRIPEKEFAGRVERMEV